MGQSVTRNSPGHIIYIKAYHPVGLEGLTGLMMADRHPTGCRSPSLLCNGKMPIGEYWTISLCADWEKLMAAIGINSPPIEWTIGINF